MTRNIVKLSSLSLNPKILHRLWLLLVQCIFVYPRVWLEAAQGALSSLSLTWNAEGFPLNLHLSFYDSLECSCKIRCWGICRNWHSISNSVVEIERASIDPDTQMATLCDETLLRAMTSTYQWAFFIWYKVLQRSSGRKRSDKLSRQRQDVASHLWVSSTLDLSLKHLFIQITHSNFTFILTCRYLLYFCHDEKLHRRRCRSGIHGVC